MSSSTTRQTAAKGRKMQIGADWSSLVDSKAPKAICVSTSRPQSFTRFARWDLPRIRWTIDPPCIPQILGKAGVRNRQDAVGLA